MSRPPLIAHVIHRLGVGGLENGLVNLLNHLPRDDYRHAVVCLTHATDFAERIRREDVTVHELNKREGKDPAVYGTLWRLFRRLRPALVHSRNLAALDAQVPAALAGVPLRVHGEHGRDIYDLTGDNRKYLMLRRLMRPLVTRWVPMSRDLERWLRERVGVNPRRIRQLYSGVDTERFRPRAGARARWPEPSLRDPGLFVIGAVGRMEAVKDPLNLVRAFARLHRQVPEGDRARLRLVYLGGGGLHGQARALLAEAGMAGQAWLPGDRDDVADLLPGFDVFALPSLGEGVSNTVLEAMACGLPVVATDVGGNRELVTADTGILVPSRDPDALAGALAHYLAQPGTTRGHGAAGRRRVEQHFALPVMVERYHSLYQELLGGRAGVAG